MYYINLNNNYAHKKEILKFTVSVLQYKNKNKTLTRLFSNVMF